jgi:hypothetical protein
MLWEVWYVPPPPLPPPPVILENAVSKFTDR